ncbi:MAG: DUF2914 domain-containing protein [Proteobacteria bacterium]|nr:DUF2914 domain-containing protein [Pseudomonadota bacterium]
MHLIIENKIMPFTCVVCLSAFFLASCETAQECPVQECPVCSSPQNNQIQLSQLNPSSRERLKKELLAEMKEDYRAEWRAEFEKEHPKADPQTESDSDAPVRPKPTAVPAKFSSKQKVERDAGGLKILRQVITTGVDHRLPIDEVEAFSVSDSSVYCFVEISAAEDIDRMITIKFMHTTGLSQSYSLPVSQSPAWRTWSKLNLTKSMTGTWLCEIFNEDNVLLASKPFVIVD